METLKDRYKDDPILLRLYRKKLPKRNWAGRKDDVEKEYCRGRGRHNVHAKVGLHS